MDKEIKLTFEMVEDIFSIALEAELSGGLDIEIRTLKSIYDSLHKYEQMEIKKYYTIIVEKF